MKPFAADDALVIPGVDRLLLGADGPAQARWRSKIARTAWIVSASTAVFSAR